MFVANKTMKLGNTVCNFDTYKAKTLTEPTQKKDGTLKLKFEMFTC